MILDNQQGITQGLGAIQFKQQPSLVVKDGITSNSEQRSKKQTRTAFVQLSGHEGSIAIAGPGRILKRQPSDVGSKEPSLEVKAYRRLMNEDIAPFIPRFYREVEYNGENYIELQDLLAEFKATGNESEDESSESSESSDHDTESDKEGSVDSHSNVKSPKVDLNIMDLKMGTRTFLESEVQNTKTRSDLYEKMVKVDPHEPTEEEHRSRAVTKLRYMQFRENLSSTSTLGFRIEGYAMKGETPVKDLKQVKTRDQVCKVIEKFLASASKEAKQQLLTRLEALKERFASSEFFANHEVIGSSLLIIHNGKRASVWMIDFAKTCPTPNKLTHSSDWRLGNHEDGYLIGLNNLIAIVKACI